MWNETHYREDEYWNAHSVYRPFLMRYQPNKRYQLLDPDAIYGIREQYDSILDTNPNLIKWEVSEVI